MLQYQEQRLMGGEKFHAQHGAVSFSEQSIELNMAPGEVCEGTFTIYGADSSAATGFVISSEPPMKVLTGVFSGPREVIAYSFDASGFAPGDEVGGEFTILSDEGEYALPFRITIRAAALESSLGPVRNLVHFVNLARTRWKEAVQIFYRKEFAEVIAAEDARAGESRESFAGGGQGGRGAAAAAQSGVGNVAGTAGSAAGRIGDGNVAGNAADTVSGASGRAAAQGQNAGGGLLTLYRGLSAREGNEHNVEEFLIASGQKQPVEYAIEPREIALDLTGDKAQLFSGQVRIRKSGWGYTCVEVAVSGDYLACSRTRLDETCFHEGVCMLSVAVDPARMHAGRNYGRIVLTPAYGEAVEIPVTVSLRRSTALRALRRREYRQIILQMMQEYIDFRSKKSDARQMAERMGSFIRRLRESDRNNPLTALYYIHYLLTVRREQDALWELQALNRRLFGLDGPMPDYSVAQFDLEDDMVYAYRMYVTILCAQGQEGGAPAGLVSSAVKAIEERRRRNPDNFWITWLLLYADADYQRRPSRMFSLLREQYERGCRSPVLYVEVWQMVRLSPSILRELGAFELQVLLFAARHGMLTDAVMTRVNDLARRRKTFSERLLRVLAMAYEAQIDEGRRKSGSAEGSRAAGSGAAAGSDSVTAGGTAPGAAAGRADGPQELQPDGAPEKTAAGAADGPQELRSDGVPEKTAAGAAAGSGAAASGAEAAGRSFADDSAVVGDGTGVTGWRRDTLESICTLLIRGNMTDARYFAWYRRGVEAGLTITRLLDYYMLSLPQGYDGGLPQIILMYYSYQNTLPWPQTACLYRSIQARRDEYGALYAQYAERIDAFTQEQLMQRRLNPDLAALYMGYLTPGRAISNEMAAAAVPLAFTRKIAARDPSQHRAVVVYAHSLQEQYGALKGGVCWMPVYGQENRIFLEDDAGNRCVLHDAGAAGGEETVGADAAGVAGAGAKSAAMGAESGDVGRGPADAGCASGKVSAAASAAASESVGSEALMDAERLIPILRQYETGNARFEMVLSEQEGLSSEITRESAPRWLRQAQSGEVPDGYRAQIRAKLLAFYEKEGDAAAICGLLSGIRPDGLGCESRAELIRLMAVDGLFEEAFSWICRFGTIGIPGDVLLRIASGLITAGSAADESALLQMAWRSFRLGNYNRALLLQLAERWDGRTAQMEEVREAAEAFDLDTYGICRRMLVQMLFTGEMLPQRQELIACCRKEGADAEFLVNVLAQSSHYSFLGGQALSEEEIRMIGDFGMDGTPLLDICRIAWLKDRSERSGEISARDLEITELFLSDLVERGVVFPFFRQFAGVLPALQAYADETLVEYRAARPDAKARILFHYAVERGGIRGQYEAREMKEMYDGVYVTGFLLFFGEQLHYYVTDDVKERNVVESGTLGQDARILAAGGDRFSEINEIAMLTALGRDEEAMVLMEGYEKKSYLVKRLFGES